MRAIKLIESYQPYTARDHFLALTKLYADADKHRTLFVSYAAPDDPSQFRTAISFDPPARTIQYRMLVKWHQRLKPGTKLMRLRPLPFDPNREVHVDGKITLLVRVRESPTAPAEPSGDFRDVIASVRSLVKDFDRQFFS